MDLVEIAPESGEFAYIIAHGVYASGAAGGAGKNPRDLPRPSERPWRGVCELQTKPSSTRPVLEQADGSLIQFHRMGLLVA
jgi:hypothetical protein